MQERDRLAGDLVHWQTQGLCPLNGPCADCDCFDPQHQMERAQAAWLLTKGWHLAASVKRLRVADDPAESEGT